MPPKKRKPGRPPSKQCIECGRKKEPYKSCLYCRKARHRRYMQSEKGRQAGIRASLKYIKRKRDEANAEIAALLAEKPSA